MENVHQDIKSLKILYTKYKNGVDIKFVLNKTYGGFGLSKKAYEYLGIEYDGHGTIFSEDRTNPKLIEVVEVLGAEASHESFAELEIETIDFEDLLTHCLKNNDGIEEICLLTYGGTRLIEYVASI